MTARRDRYVPGDMIEVTDRNTQYCIWTSPPLFDVGKLQSKMSKASMIRDLNNEEIIVVIAVSKNPQDDQTQLLVLANGTLGWVWDHTDLASFDGTFRFRFKVLS